jgi:four helix bundle protein
MENRESLMRPHERLDVWRDAMDFVEIVYRFSAVFPPDERFGLTAQLRRAAVSIPSNIAEGAARRSRREYLNFLSIARASLAEADTQLKLAVRLGFADEPPELRALVDRLFAKLTALLAKLDTAERSAP